MNKPRADLIKKRVSKVELLACLPPETYVSHCDLVAHRTVVMASLRGAWDGFYLSKQQQNHLLPAHEVHKDYLKVGDVVENTPKTRVCISDTKKVILDTCNSHGEPLGDNSSSRYYGGSQR